MVRFSFLKLFSRRKPVHTESVRVARDRLARIRSGEFRPKYPGEVEILERFLKSSKKK